MHAPRRKSAALHNVIFPGAEGANSTRPLTARATSHELVAPGGPSMKLAWWRAAWSRSW
jgi:hypothetical protein